LDKDELIILVFEKKNFVKIERFNLPRLMLDSFCRIITVNYENLEFSCPPHAVLDPRYHFRGIVYQCAIEFSFIG